MGIPRFFDRIADATLPFFQGILRQDFHDRLAQSAVTLEARPGMEEEHPSYAGFLLAANLCARLYPRLQLVAGERLTAAAADLILSVNPACDIDQSSSRTDCILSWSRMPENPGVHIEASGWNAVVDRVLDDRGVAAAPAALAVATVGVGEVFRTVFAGLLKDKGRMSPTPGGFNLVTLDEWSETPGDAYQYKVGTIHLVGAGAIGQAAALSLRESGAAGHAVVVDDQTLTLQNLQRYLLATNADIGAAKTDLIGRALEGTQLTVEKVTARWGFDQNARPGAASVVLVGVDSAQSRIDLQAGLPCRIYNAFTGPLDLGWSRHENFGTDPCLACLYWPDSPQPSRHELIAKALGQHPLRVLSYMSMRLPVGRPLPYLVPAGDLQPPADASSWLQEALLDDIARRFTIQDHQRWAEVLIDDLYHDGVCGGGIIHEGPQAGGEDLVVPLAHQSAFAGIMLATQLLVATVPELAALRPKSVEARYDVLGPPKQILARPRMRTDRCLCGDPDYVEHFRRASKAKL